jgi:hypothetical protein
MIPDAGETTNIFGAVVFILKHMFLLLGFVFYSSNSVIADYIFS